MTDVPSIKHSARPICKTAAGAEDQRMERRPVGYQIGYGMVWIGMVFVAAAICAQVYDLGFWIMTGAWIDTTAAALLGPAPIVHDARRLWALPVWLPLVLVGGSIGLIGSALMGTSESRNNR